MTDELEEFPVPLYDRAGKKISYEEYVRLRYDDENYHRVAEDHVGAYWVSTVWLGMDHAFWRGEPPLIFETMVFLDAATATGSDLDQRRWSTEAEALQGHREICLLIETTAGVAVVDESEVENEVND